MATYTLVAFDGDHAENIRTIRHAVFTGEQGVDPAIDFDGNDSDAVHVLAIDGGLAVGTGRMLADGHIGRIAVLKSHRGQQVGTGIMRCLINHAVARQFDRVWLGAQCTAEGFYRGLGFVPYGERYEEAGMAHIAMALVLDDSHC